MQLFYLIRGLPGSGKSTLAKSLKGFVHLEADMYHTDDMGRYIFNPDKIKAAHDWCQRETQSALNNKRNVVVSNTFTMLWEMEPYFKMGVEPVIIECKGCFNNIHNVPHHVIEKMKERWEDLREKCYG